MNTSGNRQLQHNILAEDTTEPTVTVRIKAKQRKLCTKNFHKNIFTKNNCKLSVINKLGNLKWKMTEFRVESLCYLFCTIWDAQWGGYTYFSARCSDRDPAGLQIPMSEIIEKTNWDKWKISAARNCKGGPKIFQRDFLLARVQSHVFPYLLKW